MIETGAMMGAEESGGFGFGMHLPERDGVYADLMLLDLFLREKAAGRWPVSTAMAQFHELAGPSYYRRVDVHVDASAYAGVKERLLVELRTNAPTELAGQPVARTEALDTNDGFKFYVADGSWLLVRFSGTEPLVRVYTEATSPRRARRDDRRRRTPGPRGMSEPHGTGGPDVTSGPDPLDDPARRPASTHRGWRPRSGRWATNSGPPPDRLGTIELPATGRPWRAVAVLGMGGSAMGADVLRAAFADRARLPIVVSRESELPAWVDGSTLVIASSHSVAPRRPCRRLGPRSAGGRRSSRSTSGGAMAELGDASGVRVKPAAGRPTSREPALGALGRDPPGDPRRGRRRRHN